MPTNDDWQEVPQDDWGEVETERPEPVKSIPERIISAIPDIPEAASEFSMSIPILGELAKKAGMGTAAVASYLKQQGRKPSVSYYGGTDIAGRAPTGKSLGEIYSEIGQMEATRAGELQERSPLLTTAAKFGGAASVPGAGLAGAGIKAAGSRILGESMVAYGDSLVREGEVSAEENAKITGGIVAAIEGLIGGSKVGRQLFTKFMAGVDGSTVKKYLERSDEINATELETIKDAIDETMEGKRSAVAKAKESEALAKEQYGAAIRSTKDSARQARETAKEAVGKANTDLQRAKQDLTDAISKKGTTPETVDKISEAMVEVRKKVSEASGHAFRILEKRGQSVDMQPAKEFLEETLENYRIGGGLTDEEGVQKIQKLIKMIDDVPRARLSKPEDKFVFKGEAGGGIDIPGHRETPIDILENQDGERFFEVRGLGKWKESDVVEYMSENADYRYDYINELEGYPVRDSGLEYDDDVDLTNSRAGELFRDFINDHDEDLVEQLRYKKDKGGPLKEDKQPDNIVRMFGNRKEKLAKSPDEAGYVMDDEASEGAVQIWSSPADPTDIYLIDKDKGIVFDADDLERWAKDLEWTDSAGDKVRKYVDEGREQLPEFKSMEDVPRLKQLYKEIYDDIQSYEHPADIIKIASDMPGVSIARKGYGKETRLPATDVKRFIQYLDRMTDKAYYEAAKAGKYRDVGDRAIVGLRRFLDSDLKAIPEYKDAMKDLAWTTEVLDKAGDLFNYDSGRKIASRINRIIQGVTKGDKFASMDLQRLEDLASEVPGTDFMQDIGELQREKSLIGSPQGRRDLMLATPEHAELARQQERLKEAEAYLRPEAMQKVLSDLPEANLLRQSMGETRAAEEALEPVKKLTKDSTQSIIQGQVSRRKPNIEQRRALENLEKSDMPGLMQSIEDYGVKELFEKPYARGSRNVNWGAISMASIMSFFNQKFGGPAGGLIGGTLGAAADVIGPQTVKRLLDFEIAIQRGQKPKLKWTLDALKEAMTRGPRAYTLTMQNLISTNEEFKKAMGFKGDKAPQSNVPTPQLKEGMGEAALRGDNGVNAQHNIRMQTDPAYRKKVTNKKK